jgi:Zn finger protein HypA/HybF involved in hydrogenase expression
MKEETKGNPMNGNWIHISFSNVNFQCPHCGSKYSDSDDKYLNRCNKNKQGYTVITCDRCNDRFGMCYDMTGKAVGFKLKHQI